MGSPSPCPPLETGTRQEWGRWLDGQVLCLECSLNNKIGREPQQYCLPHTDGKGTVTSPLRKEHGSRGGSGAPHGQGRAAPVRQAESWGAVSPWCRRPGDRCGVDRSLRFRGECLIERVSDQNKLLCTELSSAFNVKRKDPGLEDPLSLGCHDTLTCPCKHLGIDLPDHFVLAALASVRVLHPEIRDGADGWRESGRWPHGTRVLSMTV